jgi:TonB family protein
MNPMAQHTSQYFHMKPRRAAAALLQLTVAVVAANTSLPLRAADDRPSDRPVRQRVTPQYPELAKRMHVSGVVRISATVAPDGTVTATRTVSGNHMLATAAEDAIHKWKFVVAADESVVEVDINFAPAQ